MQYAPEIAIIEPNTLSALGLRTILEELLPEATVRVFSSFIALVDDTPDMYAHYFVASSIYLEHTSFFLERKYKAIVLSAGEQPSLNGIPYINICQSQEKLVRDIVNMRRHGHAMTHHPVDSEEGMHDLSVREIEVLRLISKGLINKEIAEELHISLTTVISHRKNITDKLGIKSVSGLTIYAIMHGYIEVNEI